MTTRRMIIAGALAGPALAQGTPRVLRVIPSANLTSLDPIWTTAPSTRNHGYMIYDQIAAVDSHFIARPQMAEGWEIGQDGLAWTFTLRPGLKFHDNEAVRAVDCVASIRRWQARDGFGQALAAATDELETLDDRRFRFRLKRPFPRLAAALGKSNSSQCFIMPERLALTDPTRQVTDPTGSGPFRFLRQEWVAGARAAYARFDGYVPRPEPVDGISGGRVARVERVEWTIIPDPATAAAALRANEQDFWEQPLHDLLPRLRADRNILVAPRDTTGTQGMLRFNHLQPPFDNPAIRRAVAMAVDQSDYMRAVVGSDPSGFGICRGFFACGTPLGDDLGGPMAQPSLERGRAALREAGYAGQKVVQLAATDSAPLAAMSEITADLLRRLGFNLEYVSTDWGTMLQRRNSQEPADRGGWSIFHTLWGGTDILNPAVHQLLRANGRGAWFGWPDDPELERLRAAWFDAGTAEAERAAADAIQQQAFRSMPYVPLGYYIQPMAMRRSVTGFFPSPVTVFWNLGKT